MTTEVVLQSGNTGLNNNFLLEWLVSHGESVSAGQTIARVGEGEVESAVFSPVSGSIFDILVPNGSEVKSGMLLAIIEDNDPHLSVPSSVIPISRMRKTIATRMLRSVQTMAQVTLTTEADVTEMLGIRDELIRAWRPHHVRPVDLDFIVGATAISLKEHPRMNAIFEDGGLKVMESVNIGVAVSVDDGLVVPVIKNADSKDLLLLAQELRLVATRSRNRKLSVNDLTGATFTITSLASFDIDVFTPIIDPPHVGILGVGRISEKPVVHEGEIKIRSMMNLSLTFDHRVLDGVPAGKFLQTVKVKIENPDWALSTNDIEE
jgi:pyruvate dehydrogenase E2 component (dihydrolipoamide acetyltransferase)